MAHNDLNIVVDNLKLINNIVNKNDLLIYHTNIRSVKKNLQQLWININMLDTKPHLIICTEHG